MPRPLCDRLLAAEHSVEDVAEHIRADGVPDDANRRRLQRQFRAIGIVDGVERVLSLYGEPTAVPYPDAGARQSTRPKAASSSSSLPVSRSAASVFALRAFDPARPREARIVAEIDPAISGAT